MQVAYLSLPANSCPIIRLQTPCHFLASPQTLTRIYPPLEGGILLYLFTFS